MPVFIVQKDYQTDDGVGPGDTFRVLSVEDENGNNLADEFGIDGDTLYSNATGDAELAGQIASVLTLEPDEVIIEERVDL